MLASLAMFRMPLCVKRHTSGFTPPPAPSPYGEGERFSLHMDRSGEHIHCGKSGGAAAGVGEDAGALTAGAMR
jgi:hypothetical protein